MFSFSGEVLKGTDKKNGVVLLITKEQHEKIIQECKSIQHVFPSAAQPIYPTWSYDANGTEEVSYYAKMLLSKARKESYDTLLAKESEQLLNVRIMPYSFAQVNSGTCNGFSLYYQGEFNVPKRFRMAQTKESVAKQAKTE